MIKELQIVTDSSELARLEKESTAAAASSSISSSSPASALFPLYTVKFAFSPLWSHIIYVTFPRELVVFDMQYETTLFSTPLPRGCAKFLDVLPDPDNDFLYCAHIDGKLSIWQRKEYDIKLVSVLVFHLQSSMQLVVMLCFTFSVEWL